MVVGNSSLRVEQKPEKVQIPLKFYFELDDNSKDGIQYSMSKFVKLIFPQMEKQCKLPLNQWISWIAKRAILAPENAMVDQINSGICKAFPGNKLVYSRTDATVDPVQLLS